MSSHSLSAGHVPLGLNRDKNGVGNLTHEMDGGKWKAQFKFYLFKENINGISNDKKKIRIKFFLKQFWGGRC